MKTKTIVLVLAMLAIPAMAEDEENTIGGFTGGVYRSSGVVISENMAMTPDGPIYKVGNNFITPRGFYGSNHGCYWGGGGGTITRNGTLFTGGGATAVGAGNSFISDGKINYVAGASGVSATMRKP